MKLRCTYNSIRLRVRKSDLQRLDKIGLVEEFVSFGESVLRFSLRKDEAAERVNATFQKGALTVNLPIEIANNWIHSNEVGIEVNNPLEKGGSLHILIEKDFPCLDRENEDKSDTFWELADKNPDAC